MPNLTFVLPHWAYWLGLLAFPLLATYLTHREELKPPATEVLLPIGYLLWLTAGFVGLHRLYVRSYLGLAYVPFFVSILFGNYRARLARDAVSEARRGLQGAEFEAELAQTAVDKGTAGAVDQLTAAQEQVVALRAAMDGALQRLDDWLLFSLAIAVAVGIFLVIDAILLPRLVRTCRAREAAAPVHADLTLITDLLPKTTEPVPAAAIRYPWFVRLVDGINSRVGHFIAYWSVIAVFVYYYEVIARYVFNSPTNWAHQSMFLMFGMQYLLAGGYALRVDAHVRVDVIYGMLPRRAQAILDIVTSVAFFIFTGVLLWTGYVFAKRAINVMEVSFTEWTIQYWPVKSMIAVGAFLLLLQGISKLTKDVYVVAGRGT